MPDNTIAGNHNDPEMLHRWSARKLQPVVLLYVAAVFVVLIALSYFVFNSMTAVKALAMTAVAAIVPLVPSVLMRTEYRFSEEGLERRPVTKDTPQEFEKVFRFDELSYVVPIKFGFKYFYPLDEPNTLKRIWKTHLSDAFSGEVRVEPADREKVFDVLARQGIPSR